VETFANNPPPQKRFPPLAGTSPPLSVFLVFFGDSEANRRESLAFFLRRRQSPLVTPSVGSPRGGGVAFFSSTNIPLPLFRRKGSSFRGRKLFIYLFLGGKKEFFFLSPEFRSSFYFFFGTSRPFPPMTVTFFPLPRLLRSGSRLPGISSPSVDPGAGSFPLPLKSMA